MEITLEMLHAQQETLRGLLSTVVDILSNDKRNHRKKKDDSDPILSLPPISNEKAAALLGISTRQLQRIRKTYNLKWIKRGREVLYYLGPLINAINEYQLPWDPVVFDKIKVSLNKRPLFG